MNEAEAMGERLRDLRQGAGLSQPQLAAAAGVPVASLRNWEYGRRALMLSSAYRLARAMGITLDLLAGRVFDEPTRQGRPPKPAKRTGKGKK